MFIGFVVVALESELVQIAKMSKTRRWPSDRRDCPANQSPLIWTIFRFIRFEKDDKGPKNFFDNFAFLANILRNYLRAHIRFSTVLPYKVH